MDGASDDVLDRVAKINEELKRFSPELSDKAQVLVINKMDSVHTWYYLLPMNNPMESWPDQGRVNWLRGITPTIPIPP